MTTIATTVLVSVLIISLYNFLLFFSGDFKLTLDHMNVDFRNVGFFSALYYCVDLFVYKLNFKLKWFNVYGQCIKTYLRNSKNSKDL